MNWRDQCQKYTKTQKNLTLNVRGPSYLGLTRSISWLLMPWLLTSTGHQQPWYWLHRICQSSFYLRKNFKYLCHTNVENDIKYGYMFMVTLKNLGVNFIIRYILTSNSTNMHSKAGGLNWQNSTMTGECTSHICGHYGFSQWMLPDRWVIPFRICLVLTHWGRDKMAAIFQTIFSNAFSWMKMY